MLLIGHLEVERKSWQPLAGKKWMEERKKRERSKRKERFRRKRRGRAMNGEWRRWLEKGDLVRRELERKRWWCEKLSSVKPLI